MKDKASTDPSQSLDCCPTLSPETCCDVLDLRYRLPHRVTVNDAQGRPVTVTVEVVLHARVTRCPGPLFLGDPVHSLTLLPGEKVKLFTTDRRTRFTLDSSTNLSYRNEQLSEESYFMAAVQNSMSDLSVTDHSHSSDSENGKWDFNASATGSLGFLSASADTSASGSHSGSSTSDFLHQLSTHASASANQAVRATHAAASLSIGEVATRTHIQTESEDHFESSSREFSNPNHCHAVTFFFYRLNKKQIVKITLESIERRIDDPAAPTQVSLNPVVSRGQISVIPTAVLATQKDRVDVEQIGRNSVAAQAGQIQNTNVVAGARAFASSALALQILPEPLSTAVREAAMKQVDTDLTKAGLLTAAGGVASPQAKKEFEVIVESCLPTPGIIVRGCLDSCDICEPEVEEKIKLDLEEQELRNQLLKRQIELLEKSQEYRGYPPAPVAAS